ncbi:NAD-dependent epimerase/dehydratase family protein [Haloferax sp. ATB1]|uniref:NAD-dependent epimerase/dehydratase family protein n=1 Tax=Haloferax sp. ATB1 TaxID=1508454 RepID=UPI0005B22D2D|nr:NAD-dependent epimerase/dehydratase family protein [Haloferax sp. ATB1]
MADISGQTVLVTGGAGFIGSHIVDVLAEDNEVRVVDDLSSGSASRLPDSVELVQADIRDSRAIAEATFDVDLIFHQAAKVSVSKSVDDPFRCHSVNTTATLRLLESARREDARVVLASSAAIYGRPRTVPVREDEPKEPKSPYGLQKLSIDRYARLYHELYGLETVALRYFNVYGPRQSNGDYSGVIGTFLEQARAGEPITVDGDGKQTRDFVYVDDVVRANLLAAKTDEFGVAYNIGTGSETAIHELAEIIKNATASNSPIVHGDPRRGDIQRSCADISRAESRIGYAPQVALDDGVKRLLTSYGASPSTV